ncbi:hypothetical protein [Gimesia sp.]|uniref:hypothetical protein n=1 Tax=Gimesia sp. TaxID=2024833 RepID=UPI000C5F9B25|nr:hypothetical protein [Gimesia sp.]MAX36203.1 hypothetical protein [Gimesia sp.]HAH46641.1 hypothetical protein [Planctomycetaceae bacterium]HBL45526.1 hypothetical protein [Planctomycetaceae bacterium]
MEPGWKKQKTQQQSPELRLVLIVMFFLILFASQHVWAGSPEIMVSVEGPFPTREYGPGEGIYVGNLLVSGETFHELNLNVPDLARVRSLSTSRHDDEFNVGVAFVFPGKSSDRKLQVTARLRDECGNILQSQSRICGDARNNPGDIYFSYMAPARFNSHEIWFKGCEHLQIHRVEVTLMEVKEAGE